MMKGRQRRRRRTVGIVIFVVFSIVTTLFQSLDSSLFLPQEQATPSRATISETELPPTPARRDSVDFILEPAAAENVSSTTPLPPHHNADHHLRPRVVLLQHPKDELSLPTNHTRTVRSLTYESIDQEPPPPLEYERHYMQDCEPVETPALFQFHPTCVDIHALQLQRDDISLLSMDGSWRSVWRYQETNETVAVIKLLQLQHNFTAEAFELQSMDAKLMDYLTSSPHIVNAFAACGTTALTEYATKMGGEILKDSSLTLLDRLRIARDLALGLTQLHTLHVTINVTDTSSPAIPLRWSHHDITLANLVSINRRMLDNETTRPSVQWNDLNLGLVRRRDKNTGKICPTPNRYPNPLWRSPEEILHFNATNGVIPNPMASDVYSFGNILFQLLTKRQPWTHLEPSVLNGTFGSPNQAALLKTHGILPTIPDTILQNKNNKSMEHSILYEAMVRCYRFEPEQRPTSFQLARGFSRAYDRLNGNTTSSSSSSSMMTLTEVSKLFQ